MKGLSIKIAIFTLRGNLIRYRLPLSCFERWDLWSEIGLFILMPFSRGFSFNQHTDLISTLLLSSSRTSTHCRDGAHRCV